MSKKIKNNKKGMPIHSKMTDTHYLVFKWYDYGNGKIEALDKKKVTFEEAQNRYNEILSTLFSNQKEKDVSFECSLLE